MATGNALATDDGFVHCTMVNKVMEIGILDFELGAFSETLEHMMTETRRIFGFSLQKKKF